VKRAKVAAATRQAQAARATGRPPPVKAGRWRWIVRKGRRVGRKLCLPVTDEPGSQVRDVLFQLRWAVEDQEHFGVSYVATIVWPDAPDKHGRPSVTHASTPFMLDPEEGAEAALDLFDSIMEEPKILDRRPGRSGMPGRAAIVEICAWILVRTRSGRPPRGYKRVKERAAREAALKVKREIEHGRRRRGGEQGKPKRKRRSADRRGGSRKANRRRDRGR
jgi:hypothetical protein